MKMETPDQTQAPPSNPTILDATGRAVQTRQPHLKPKRPLAITVICILSFIGVGVAFLLPLSGATMWLSPIDPVITLGKFAGMVGLWHMKRWGLWTALGCFGVGTLIILERGGGFGVVGTFTTGLLPALIMPTAVALVGALNYKKMR